MIPGIVASSVPPAGGGEEWPPEGAIAALDFINGRYYDGSETTAADMLAQNPDYGGDFDAALDIGVDGLVTDRNVTAAFSAEVTTMLFAGSTMVIDLSMPGEPGQNSLIVQPVHLPEFDVYSDFLFPNATDLSLERYNEGDDPESDSTGNTVALVGDNKVAWSLKADLSMALSVNGDAVITLAGFTPAEAMNAVALVVSRANEEAPLPHIRSIIIYPVKTDGELPALSTL